MDTKPDALLLPPPRPTGTVDENYTKQLYNWNLSILGILKTLISDVYRDIKGLDDNDAGYVVGPATNTDGYVPLWDGADANTLKNGVQLDTDGTLAGNSDTRVSSQKAIKTYAGTKLPGGDSYVTFAADMTVVFSVYGSRRTSMTGNTNITLTGMVNGGVYRLMLSQDATGSRLVSSWVTTVKWADNTAPTLTTTAWGKDIITFVQMNDIIYGAATLNFG
jgi:hypothetical protein